MRTQPLSATALSMAFLIVLLVGCAPSTSTPILPAGDATAHMSTSTATSAPEWTVPVGSSPIFRAVHMDGNDATNRDGGVRALSPDYFAWLRDTNVNWVGLSAELHVSDSMDSTVEIIHSGVKVPAFADEDLVRMFREFRKHGINVYLTMNFDPAESRKADHPVKRWQMGCPDSYLADSSIQPEYWPWAPDHPDHERFVSEFWQTYTEQVVHYARLAQEEGVGLLSLGTETECLFRTRAGSLGANDFQDEIRAMVEAVRAVYQGPLTYDQHYEAFMLADDTHVDALWEDAGLDTIGISAYIPLVEAPPTSVMSVEELEARWESIFGQYLIPLHEKYPDKTILFTEFGYTAWLTSPFNAADHWETLMLPSDSNGNGVDDGQEVQANIYQALFNVMNRHPGVLGGAFLWGNFMASDEQWRDSYFKLRGWDIRWKPSELVVRDQYCAWIGPECTSQPVRSTATPWPTVRPPTPTLASEAIESGLAIYDDGLELGWRLSEYLSTIDMEFAGTVAQGASSIKVEAHEKWGSLKLTGMKDLKDASYTWLSFMVNPGDIRGFDPSVTIFMDGKNFTYVYSKDYAEGKAFPANTWTRVTIPLADLNPDGVSFNSFYFETEAPGTFYLDDIRLVNP